jgi:(p)ppGpp synthase/HD superfamily hydrolase
MEEINMKRNYKEESIDFSKALVFAASKHAGQLRKDGVTPYIVHPLRVAQSLKGYEMDYQLAALLHDVLEDTDATEDEVLACSNEKVLEAVKLLTKDKTDKNNFDEEKYVEKILLNPIAKAVKEADRVDNLKDTFFADPEFQRKYIEKTEVYYKGKFGYLLDKQLEETIENYETRKNINL